MKKNIILLILLSIIWINNVFWTCTYDWTDDLTSDDIDACVTPSGVLATSNMEVAIWFKEKIQSWITTISWILWLLAVWSIAFGWFMLVVSTGEEDKLKKWKDIIKWSIIWFLWVISAGVLIRIIIWVLI